MIISEKTASLTESTRSLLEIRLRDLKVPPDLPGVGEHLPDVLKLDPAEGLASCEIKRYGHLDKLGLLLRGQSQKFDIKSVAVDLS